jgi:hypothetical protein
MSALRTSLFAAALGLISIAPAQAGKPAECTTLSYSVNDYGKDGPTKDAQDLLDKYIVKWTANKGVKKYKVGKKDVDCDLFLDVGLFNEYTCKAKAQVCWQP